MADAKILRSTLSLCFSLLLVVNFFYQHSFSPSKTTYQHPFILKDGKYSKLTAMEKKEYKKSVLEYADVQDAIRCARQNSLEEGREQGREVERWNLAMNMLAEGIAPDMVARISGLTEDEVLALVQE